MTRPDNDDNHMTQAKLTDFVCELLGGRVAEEIVIKDVSTGASNDLQRCHRACAQDGHRMGHERARGAGHLQIG